MDTKVDLVVDSIKKLLALNVSEDEIQKELAGVGITRDDAITLIAKAKGTAATETQKVSQAPASPAKPVFDTSVPMDEQIVTQLSVEKEPAAPQQKTGTPPLQKNISQNQPARPNVAAPKIKPSEVDFGLLVKQSPKQNKERADITDDDDEATIGSVLSSIREDNKKTASEQERVPENAPEKVTPQPPAPRPQPQKKEVPKPKAERAESRPVIPQVSFDTGATDAPVDEFWKKGVVVAVNSRLSEMKKLKEDIDKVVQDKVDSSVRKELQQFKVLLDSQKELLISSNRAALEEKQREITFIIDAKIAELKQYNKQLTDNLAALESAKKEQELSLSQVQQTLDDARKTKAQLMIEMNSELMKSKSSAQTFIDQSEKHMRELDERVNRTLELEKNIAEGMIANAEQKIEGLTIQRADELIEDLEVTVNKLKAIESQVNPELLQQKIKVLDDFKKQFVTTMKDNLTEINVAITDLNQKNNSLERSIEEKMLVLDAKIEELTKFEKNFTALIQSSLHK